jgi:integrase
VHRHISARRESSAMANHALRYYATYCDSSPFAGKVNIPNVFGHILALLDFVTFYRVLFPPGPRNGTTEGDVMRTRISKRTVDKLRPGESIADLDVRGFSARRLPSGAISYDLRYRTATGERRRLSLGVHGRITPDQARAIAEKRLDDIAQDRDPATERQRQRATTVNAVLDNYIARVLGSKRSKPAQVSAFDRLVRPEIGTRSIYDLRRADIARLMDRIEDSSGPVAADRTLAYLRAAFHWQQSRDDDFLSPIIRGMERTSIKELARDRVLTDDEIRAIWQATDRGTFGTLVRFLLLTAARRDEARLMTWDEIDGTTWTLPPARNKTKVELVRPLSKSVLAIIKSLPSRNAYVFGGRGDVAINGKDRSKKRLDLDSGVTGWRLHDLRRTARSLMSRAGVPSDHAELCLGHVLTGVRGTYDRHAYQAEKAAAFEKLADLVAEIVHTPRR